MPPSRDEWGSAFALQSRSDWRVYERLAAEPQISACHELHYLQMACEKIAHEMTRAEAMKDAAFRQRVEDRLR